MRHLALLIPCLALQLLGSCAPGSPTASGPLAPLTSRERTAAPKPTAQPADPNSTWMAMVNARIRDASHQFFVDGADLRAEVPERGLTARFDHAGAHIASAHDATPIALRTTRVGRAASATPIVAAAPALGDCQEGKADPEGHCIPRLEYASGGLTEWWEAGPRHPR